MLYLQNPNIHLPKPYFVFLFFLFLFFFFVLKIFKYLDFSEFKIH